VSWCVISSKDPVNRLSLRSKTSREDKGASSTEIRPFSSLNDIEISPVQNIERTIDETTDRVQAQP
jgi:hypothetical protein